MNRLLGAVLALAPAAQGQGGEDFARLKAWWAAWRQGRVDLHAPVPVGNNLVVLDAKDERLQRLLAAPGQAREWSREAEMRFLLDGAAAEGSPEAVDLLLTMASHATAREPAQELTLARADESQPWFVRLAAVEALGKMTTDASHAEVARVAFDSAASEDRRVAALLAIGRHARPGDAAAVAGLLAAPADSLRHAAQSALGSIGTRDACERLRAAAAATRIAPRERTRALAALADATRAAAAGLPPAEASDLGLFAAGVLADVARPYDDRAAAARILWEARGSAALPLLVDILRANQPGGERADLRVRDLAHGILLGWLGQGTAPADEPDRWAQIVAADAPRIAKRGDQRGPFPAPGPARLQKLVVRGSRIAFLVDASAGLNAPMPAPARGRAGGAPDRDRNVNQKVGEVVRDALTRCLEALPAGTSFRLVLYHKTAESFPPRGWAVAGEPPAKRAAAFLAQAKGSGAANLYAGLHETLGLGSLGPLDGFSREDLPTDVYWIATGPPQAGLIRSPQCLRLVLTSLNAVHGVSFHALLAPEQPRPSNVPRNTMHAGFASMLRDFAPATGGAYAALID